VELSGDFPNSRLARVLGPGPAVAFPLDGGSGGGAEDGGGGAEEGVGLPAVAAVSGDLAASCVFAEPDIK